MLATTESNMSNRRGGERHLDLHEARQVELAGRALAQLPAGAPVTGIFDAIRGCVPFAAGLLCTVRPDAPDSLVAHPAGLPPAVLESWLGTSPEQIAGALAPVVSSTTGRLWRDSQTLTGAQRERLEVLRKLDEAGLGEGAGYKVIERRSPGQGAELVMLALLMERGVPVPARAAVVLASLNQDLHAAVLRSSLTLLTRSPIVAQILDQEQAGYLCLSLQGRVTTANRRAHQLVARYREVAGVIERRNAMTDFAARARVETRGQRSWCLQAPESTSLLLVDAYHLAGEAHALAEDTLLLKLREILPPASSSPLLEKLTEAQRRVALHLLRSGEPYKIIAVELGMNEKTLRKHVENIFSRLDVSTRSGLVQRLK
jgi:DNA-binding CsgD family transcriptional regulator